MVDCVSELGQHHVDAQQAGERGNNLVSDILLNAYISYNVSALKTWSRHSSGGVSLYLLCNPSYLGESQSKLKSKPTLALFHPQLKAFLTFTCVVEEGFSFRFFVRQKADVFKQKKSSDKRTLGYLPSTKQQT